MPQAIVLMTNTERPPAGVEQTRLERLCTSIRGKLQFMDYLVRAALADAERFQDETDPGTRIFIRQLIEMHTNNLSVESENMRLVGDFCTALESALSASPLPQAQGEGDES